MISNNSRTTGSIDAWLASKTRSQQFTIVPFSARGPHVAPLLDALSDPYIGEWKRHGPVFQAFVNEAAMLEALATAHVVVVIEVATNRIVGGAALKAEVFDFFVVSAYRAEGQTIAILQMACLPLVASPALGRAALTWVANSGDLPMLRLQQKIDRTFAESAFAMTPRSTSHGTVDTSISNPSAFIAALASAVTLDSKKRRTVRMHPGGAHSQHASPFDMFIEAAKSTWPPSKPSRAPSEGSICSSVSLLSDQLAFAASPVPTRHNPYGASVVETTPLRHVDFVWVSNNNAGWDSCTWVWADTDAIVLDQQGPYCYLSTPLDFPFLHLAVTRAV